MHFTLEFPPRSSFAAEHLFVGEYCCPGEKRHFALEPVHHFEIGIQYEGTHVRKTGGERHVVERVGGHAEPLGRRVPARVPDRSPPTRNGSSVRPGALSEMAIGDAARVCTLSSEAALLHRRLTTARGPVAKEELALALAARVVEDASSVLAPPAPRTPPPSWRRLAEEVQHVIATRSGEKLTLGAIAGACGVSTFHASRVFRTVTGGTIHEQLNRVRLRKALLSLAGRAGDLTQVALESGFSSHSHFTASFRAEYGVTPRGVLSSDGQ